MLLVNIHPFGNLFCDTIPGEQGCLVCLFVFLPNIYEHQEPLVQLQSNYTISNSCSIFGNHGRKQIPSEIVAFCSFFSDPLSHIAIISLLTSIRIRDLPFQLRFSWLSQKP